MKKEFKAQIIKVEGKNASYIEIPFDVEAVYKKKRVKVKAKFDGIEYRGSIVKMGMPCFMIGITKEIREKLSKTFGDTINVEIEEDLEERVIEIPKEFEEALNKNDKAKEFFNSLSFSMKKKYINSINSAKKEETKLKRIKDYIEKLENEIKI
ncbi:YdeI/OmpD-associated family protein [Clostridium sp. LY3-2]|uniref:YdeI/OmpD-associated family protein n=1 Tax=Clostridium sp. LY3-2 TaxID=2942482 RepID=UPI002152B061|nr:YdeI/OmpD-associated family protein [Clostridium sp. LY3-2]MCR6514549.1 YdeI/OmpD-associated family protein [Clostridium sp. LY3-2]